MQGDLERVLITRERIAKRIEALGREISSDLAEHDGHGEIILVPVLTGSIIFVADLMRQLSLKVRIGVVTARSYPGSATSSKGDPILGDLPGDLRGTHVLIVDDILDSGRTIRTIRARVTEHEPRSVRACALLRKRIPSAMETPCEYVGFDIDNEFVVGYGLDYNDCYRNLPDIGVLRRELMQ